jgi:hypothetical protein
MHKELLDWINLIIEPQEKIDGHSICPFAKLAKRSTFININNLDIVPPSSEEFEVVIYILPDTVTDEELNNTCHNLNVKYDKLVFLPDHKDRNTFINDVKTNNGHKNLILCQPKDKLRNARKALSTTTYYSFWDKEYLKEILGEDYGNLD